MKRAFAFVARGVFTIAIATFQAIIISLMIALPILASQNNLWNPTSGTLSGLTMVQNYNNALDSVNTCNSGGTAPANQLSGTPSLGNCWDDTSTGGWIKHKVYDGTQWIVTRFTDTTNHLYVGVVGGGAVQTIAAASTTDLCSLNPAFVWISGSTPISSFGTTCSTGTWKRIYFLGGPTLVYNASSMVLPTAANISVIPGDTLDAVATGSGTWIITSYIRASGAALSTVGLNIGAAALGSSALGFNQPINLGLSASVASNALTVTLTDAGGAAPSAASPVLIPFRSATLSNGVPQVNSVTSSLSITVAAGNTMGCASNVACRIWIYAIRNTSSTALGLMSCSNATTIFPCNDDLLYSTAAGTSGGSSNGVLYASTGSLSGVAVRIIGYLEATESTAGTWATAPAKLQLMGPGVKKPGDILQDLFTSSSTQTTGSGTSNAVAPPSLSITPQSGANLVSLSAVGVISESAGSHNAMAQFFRTAGASAACTSPVSSGAIMAVNTTTGPTAPTSLAGLDQPNTTSQQTYALCIRNSSSGSNTVYCTSSLDGTNPTCSLEIKEIMGALGPANENRQRLAKVA